MNYAHALLSSYIRDDSPHHGKKDYIRVLLVSLCLWEAVMKYQRTIIRHVEVTSE